MLIKAGNKIVNTDQLVYADFDEGDGPSLTLYLVNVYAGNERRTTHVRLSGDAARATWKLLSDEARDMTRP
ncbi:MAG TPA: hypothetical protein VGB98_00190 [Pyrinomonadaceae bacterium]|jgi:hypothetical protein